jgi:hypothetical protein
VNAFRRPLTVSAQSRIKMIGVLLVVLLLLAFWWWPGLVGAGDPTTQPAVLVMGNGELQDAQTVVTRRLIEEGYTVAWLQAPSTWCDVVNELLNTDVRPTLGLVIALEDPESSSECTLSTDEAVSQVEEAKKVFAGAHIALVDGLSESFDPVVAKLKDMGVRVVDPTPMLAGVDERVDCMWWDDCIPDGNGFGYVIVRDGDGLTLAGQQRVARMIVANIQ